MPNKLVRSSQLSGMRKYTDGGVPSQGIPENVNSTYPDGVAYPQKKADEQQVKVKSLVDDVPVNITYAEKLPSVPTPLGSVNLAPVELGGKK